MSATQYRLIELVILPRAARLPSDIGLLSSVAEMSFCPVKSVERRVRADYLAVLISDAIVELTDEKYLKVG